MMKIFLYVSVLMIFLPLKSAAQFLDGEIDDYGGALNPTDFSWHYYQEQMDRFPDRIGTICYNAYLLDKGGLHSDSEKFLIQCAQRGSTSAMIYLALLYEQGTIRAPQPVLSTQWLAKAAKAGNPIAQYHYGMALIKGAGVTEQPESGIQWIAKAAKQGEVLAIKHLAETRCLSAHCQ
ncbi:hypothetical protein [uncultured Alteromonas sp.]|jgi:TPR repeat protein|uniref:tetratricopeptide repeat protein n=1 Tax=uncultured Alteromonas sp. TaxID=179113 RepID=UPI0025CC4B43|nr:hypothetical protein [uncultured Alteromonas sp.]